MHITTEEKIRVHFSSLVKALEELRNRVDWNDIDPKTHSEIRAIELKLDEIKDKLLDLQF